MESVPSDTFGTPRALSRPLSVLVVDDDELLREFLALKIAGLGCDVEAVEDGETASARLEERAFDVLVTDWNMPGMDGMELVRRLRTSGRDHYVYVIMVTASTDREGVRAGLRAGVDDFIRKPVDDIELELGLASARRIVDLQRREARRARHIAAAHRRTREAYRQIKSDLEAAAATQRQLLPPPGDFGGLRTAGIFLPSTEIGGDIYNVVSHGDGRLVFFHVDVAGHGVPAALRSFALHNQLSNTAPTDPASLVATLNSQTIDRDQTYFTMIYGVAESSGRCTFVRAGHPYALHRRRRTDTVSIMEQGGLPVGLLPTADFPESVVDLEPGDRLFLYSDGIVDCTDPKGGAYGEDRLIAAVRRTGDLDLAEAVAAIADELAHHRGRAALEDDVSLLAIERAIR